jgi:hypothetical protein
MRCSIAVVSLALVSLGTPLAAQWLNYPTAGMPRAKGRQAEPVGASSETG